MSSVNDRSSSSLSFIPNQSYHYPKLLDASREIRLLRFLPEKYPDHLALEMTVSYLEEVQGQFAAISYTWGDADDLVPITVDAQKFLITRNGAEALKRVRKHALRRVQANASRETRRQYGSKAFKEEEFVKEAQKYVQWGGKKDRPVTLFWMDAACINQRNTKEKEDQIRIMGKIYSAASYVASFIGNSDSLGEIMRAGSVLGNSKDSWTELSYTIQTFASLPYFDRMWIVQEMLLATELWFLCGSDGYLASSVFYTIIAIIEIQVRANAEQESVRSLRATRLYKLLQDKYENQRNGRNDLPLAAAVEHYIGGKCRDRKDQIYSLVGLDNIGKSYPVRYSSSNAEVLAHFAVMCCATFYELTRISVTLCTLLDIFYGDRQDTEDFKINALSETERNMMRTHSPENPTHFRYFYYGQFLEGLDRIWMSHIFVDPSKPSTDFRVTQGGHQQYPLILDPVKAETALSVEKVLGHAGLMCSLDVDPVDFLEALALSKDYHIYRGVRMSRSSTIEVPTSFALNLGWRIGRDPDELFIQ